MNVVKSVTAGLVAGVLALVAWIAVRLALALLLFEGVAATGAGGLGAVSIGIDDWSGAVVIALGFVIGFRWMWKRSTRRRTA